MSEQLYKFGNSEFDLSSLDDLMLPEVKEEIDPNEDKFIINSRQIDTHTIKRTRVKLTPGVCDVCGFDLVRKAYEQNKLSTAVFDDLPPEIQTILGQAVIKHKQTQHTAADNLIVTSSQLKKAKKWLSGRDV
jgi:hypothetical protein